MHELAIAESLIKQLLKIAGADDIPRIKAVTLQIGELSGIDTEALDMALPFVAENTILENTVFRYEEVKTCVKCALCGRISTPVMPVVVCGHCSSTEVEIIQGREFVIKEFELP